MNPSDYKISAKITLDRTLGYMYFCDVKHPLSDAYGKTYYHRHVASVKIGRWLTNDEIVHHINGVKDDNTISNIEVMSSSDHTSHHQSDRKTVMLVMVCQTCKLAFNRPASQVKYKHHFCSMRCSRIFYGSVDYPENEYLQQLLLDNPATVVAETLGISSSSLKRHCKRNNIETMPRGYWTKLKYGPASGLKPEIF